MIKDDIIPGYPLFASDWTEEIKPVLYLVEVAYNVNAIGEYDYVPNFSLNNLFSHTQTYWMNKKHLDAWVWGECQFDSDEDVWTARC